jgi:hypothetical protein
MRIMAVTTVNRAKAIMFIQKVIIVGIVADQTEVRLRLDQTCRVGVVTKGAVLIVQNGMAVLCAKSFFNLAVAARTEIFLVVCERRALPGKVRCMADQAVFVFESFMDSIADQQIFDVLMTA